jgi:anti-sigma regulatory factor (Ser/Thr protein kinase)
MISDGTETTEDRLILRSELSEIAAVPVWLERLGAEYKIPGDLQFAMDLCLEEAISNVIRHGYKSEPNRFLTVRFSHSPERVVVFTVDDEAPHFNPLEVPEASPVGGLDDLRIGGQGIRLLRRFTSSLEYERKEVGNRLRMSFSLTNPPTATD